MVLVTARYNDVNEWGMDGWIEVMSATIKKTIVKLMGISQ